MGERLTSVIALGVLAWVTVGIATPGHAQSPIPPGGGVSNQTLWTPAGVRAATSQDAGQGSDPMALLKTLVNVGTGRAFEGLPDWAKRIDLQFDFGLGKPDYSVFTVQPLLQSTDRVDTLFTQVRFALVEEDEITTNLGLGYRRLLIDETVMLGGNLFWDKQWDERHERAGVGLEIRTTAVELNANYYDAVSGKKRVGALTFERALDGYDIELGAQLPFLPWVHAFGRVAYWNGIESRDVRDTSVSLRMRPFPFLEIEAGRFDDNIKSPDFFVSVRLSFGGTRGTAASERLVDSEPWRLSSMRDHTLDRVRRDNNIRVERTTKTGAAAGGTVSVTVARK